MFSDEFRKELEEEDGRREGGQDIGNGSRNEDASSTEPDGEDQDEWDEQDAFSYDGQEA